jgi:actin-related protein
MASLLSIKDCEVRKKFLTNILVIGGGSHMPKLTEEIILKLNKKLDINGFEDKA